MRFLPALLLLILVVSAQPQSQPVERVSLEIDSQTVWLGMPKADVAKKFTDIGYKIVDSTDGTMVAVSDKKAHTFHITNGRLDFADVGWYQGDGDIINAVLGALGALADKTNTPCLVEHQPISKPNQTVNRVFISCGERSVLILNGKLDGATMLDVSERIGNFQR